MRGSGQALGPSDSAFAGSGCVSMNTPAMPLATGWLQQGLAQALRFDARAVANPHHMIERLAELTTTMMWISGISPAAVFHAYVAAIVALFVCGIPAALQQHLKAEIDKWSPLIKKAGVYAD